MKESWMVVGFLVVLLFFFYQPMGDQGWRPFFAVLLSYVVIWLLVMAERGWKATRKEEAERHERFEEDRRAWKEEQ